MKNNTTQLVSAALIAVSSLCTVASAGVVSSIVLDDFSTDPNTEFGGVGIYSSVIYANPFNQSSSFTLDTLFNSGADTGAVFFNSGIGVKQGASIEYSNNGAGLNLNAGATGVLGFEMDFLASDQGFTVNIELGNNGDGPSGLGGVASWSVYVPAGSSLTAAWSLADFIISPNFDVNDIDTIYVTFNTQDNPTASLDFVATEFRMNVVPAPSAAALFGVGGLVLMGRRRR